VFGWFADYSRSRRVPLLLGLVALGGATALLCIGSTIALLVVGRLLQGISAAVVWTVGLALLVDTVGQNEVGQAMGYVNLSMSLGVLVAPLLGGVVYEKGGYYSVFGMAFGLVGLDIVLRLMLVEKKIASQWTTTSGGVEYGTMMVSQEGHIEQVQEPPMERRDTPPPDGPVGSPDAGGPHAHPSPVVTMLKSRRLLAALWGCLVQAALMTSFDSVCPECVTVRIGLVNVIKVIPLFVKRVFNWNSSGAGIIFLALIIPSFSSPLVGIYPISPRFPPPSCA
jgi:MFS family permease